MKSKYSKSKIAALTLTFVCATTAMASATTLQYGDKGRNVIAVQQQLIKHGYNATDKNGVYGKETKWAVRLFQQDRGLPVDGIIGPATYNALMGAPRTTKAVLSNNAATKAVATKSAFTNQNAQSRRLAGQNVKLNNLKKVQTPNNIHTILAEADKYRGVPYVFGGTTPSGFDCSGYVKYVFAKQGIALPRLADEQFNVGVEVSRANLKAGDLVFFETYEPGPSHSGIYIGNGKFISATSSRGVAVADLDTGYWGERYIGAKRVI
ncbi:MAG: NlpC/P60 family protein [Veillonella sp.]